MSDYTEFVIAAEDELAGPQGRKICLYNAIWESSEVSSSGIAAVSCRKLLPEIETCHAEVLCISSGATINSRVWKHFKVGDSVATAGWNDSVVIRALEEKQKILKEFDSRSAADVTFVVNDEECIGDRKLLAAVSPVFNAMLYGKFAEAQQDRIVLEGIESAETFKDFFVSGFSSSYSGILILIMDCSQPNPSNVTALLKLAHQFDIPFLARMCEDHLMHCYEISSIDRLFLAEKYSLNALKLRITHGLKYSSR